LTVLDARETKDNSRARFPTGRKPHANDCDHEDDSNLEEGDDDLSGRDTGL
jgi:hypothetical protein